MTALPHHVLRSASDEVDDLPAQHVTGEREHVLTDFLSAQGRPPCGRPTLGYDEQPRCGCVGCCRSKTLQRCRPEHACAGPA